MSCRVRHLLLAVAAAAALLLSGCEMFAPPVPGPKAAENVGVDPTGETIDTGTLPPDDLTAEDEPAAQPPASPPRTAPQPPPRPKAPPATAARPKGPPAARSSQDVQVGAAGMVHHHLTGSGDGSGDDSGASGDSGGDSGDDSSGDSSGDSGDED